MGCGGRKCYCCSCMRSDETSSPRVEASNGERMLNGNGNGNGEVLRKDESCNPNIVPLKSNLKRASRFSEGNGDNTNATPIDGFRVTITSVNGIGHAATNSVDGIREEENTAKPMEGIRESSNNGMAVDGIEEHSVEAGQEEFHANGRRRVQWTDAHGQDLAEVREFEPSDSNHSDDDGGVDSDDACTCCIQ